jgi:hypothetical protein
MHTDQAMMTFYDTAPCSLVEVDRVKMMEAVRTSETSVCFNDTIQLYKPEGYHLHTRRRENVKSHRPSLI